MKVSAPYTSRSCLKLYYTFGQCQCLELLMIEFCKYLNDLSPQTMNDIFKLRKNTSNLRNVHSFESQIPRTKRYRLDCTA